MTVITLQASFLSQTKEYNLIPLTAGDSGRQGQDPCLSYLGEGRGEEIFGNRNRKSENQMWHLGQILSCLKGGLVSTAWGGRNDCAPCSDCSGHASLSVACPLGT